MNRKTMLSSSEEEKIYRWTVHGAAENASDAARARHAAWLEEKPERLRKARQVRNLWRHPDFEKAVQLVGGNALPEAAAVKSHGRPWYLAYAAALLLALSVALPIQFGQMDSGSQLYTTLAGQTSHATLADGSGLDLSARSRVAVEFTDAERRIRLYDGEAQFTVAKDRRRPFVVESRQASIVALGTVFNVDQRQGVTELTVLEGTVAVHPRKQPGRELKITTGERLRISADTIGAVQKFDLDTYKSWLHGLVQVEDMRLEELLVEFNRFSSKPVIAGDHKTRNLRVSGTFELDRIETNIRILATLHGLAVSESGEEIVLHSGK